MQRSIFSFLIVLTLLALPALAQDESAIVSGIDAWNTPADGSSYADFYLDPIPADFFCTGSKAWSGRIAFGGEPVATFPEGALGNSDTVMLRLDDATFDNRGVASTRLQVQALNLVGLKPIKTLCGAFTVRTFLVGTQPITEMKIVRTKSQSGFFLAPVAVNIRMVFTPENSGKALELSREIVFDATPNAAWTQQPGEDVVTRKSSLVVDSDGDGQPDLTVPGTSNFTAGRETNNKLVAASKQINSTTGMNLIELNQLPHVAPTHIHNVQTGVITQINTTVMIER